MLLLASSIGLSRLLEKTQPAAAATLFPLNVDARLSLFSDAISGASDGDGLQPLKAELIGTLRANGGEARLYSLLGELARRDGDQRAADAYFAKARTLSKTDFLALQRTIVRSLETEDLKQAVELLDILLRRWPGRFAEIGPSLAPIMSTKEGYDAVLDAVKEDAPWRSGLVGALARDAFGVQVAERLLLDLRGTPLPARSGEISSVIAGYFQQKRYEEAYRFFLFSLSPEEQKLGGFVYNSDFAPLTTGRQFDWQMPNKSSLDISFAGSPETDPGKRGMVLRFLNKPVKGAVLRQYTQLPPGDYQVTVVATGRSLKLPKQLLWSISCVDDRKALMTMDVPEGTFTGRTFTGRFRIGMGQCVLQDLRLETALVAESWRHRYAGSLELVSVRVERLAS